MKMPRFCTAVLLFGCSLLAAALTVNSAQADPEKADPSAREVIQHYYTAIDHGHYKVAYSLWCNNGTASGKSLSDFAAGFADTAHTSVATDKPTDPEGAAGSLYVTVPTRVTAVRKDGTPQHYAGQYVLRRCNNVDGCSAEDRRWHIYSASLHAVK